MTRQQLRERRRLEHDLHTAAQRIGLETLGRRLWGGGPLAVRHDAWNRTGDRVAIELDDDTVLRLRLYRPKRTPLAALIGLHWSEQNCWAVSARTTAGDWCTLEAWRAELAAR